MTIYRKFISFEGGEGAGKSTLVAHLDNWLRTLGHDVKLTREPGGSAGGEQLRELLLFGPNDGSNWSSKTEMLLFMAARRDHVEKIILPALAENSILLCDRFLDSSLAYQALDERDLELLLTQHETWINVWPELTFWLDIHPKTALQRVQQRAEENSDPDRRRKKETKSDRFESREFNFHESIYHRYQALHKKFPQRIIRLDASQNEEKLAAQAKSAMQERCDWLSTRSGGIEQKT